MDGGCYTNATFENDSISMVEVEPSEKWYEKDEEINMPKKQLMHYKRNLLTNAQKNFAFLEHQSLVDFIEAGSGYIVSAGRDHHINIWDGNDGKHVRRLSGHNAPITGLQLLTTEHSSLKGIIISASEDGSIRRWSLIKGEELGKIEVVDSVITCMGVINEALVVVGNHKGYVEVRHLEIGELYSSILAHEDPVDALVVEGQYACSATFEAPSCLKVWEMQFEQMICIYRIENSPKFQFCSLAIWHTSVFLGASDVQKVHVIDFKANEKGIIDLGCTCTRGGVQHIRVWNEWILSCVEYKGEVVLDVNRIHNYEHFGTFNSNMKQVHAIAAMESNNSFKIVLGGSTLAVLSFDFSLTQDEDTKAFQRYLSIKKPPRFAKNIFIDEVDGDKLSDSDGDDFKTENYNSYENTLPKVKSKSDEIDRDVFQKDKELEAYIDQGKKEIMQKSINQKSVLTYTHPGREDDKFFWPYKTRCESKSDEIDRDVLHKDKELEAYIDQGKKEIMQKRINQNSVLTYMYPGREANQFFLPDKTSYEKMLQSHAEPRATIRQLEKILDENNQSKDLKKIMNNNEIYEALKDRNNAIEKYRRNKLQENVEKNENEVKHEGFAEKEKNQVETDEANTDEVKKICSHLLNVNTKESYIENKGFEKKMPQENKNSGYVDKVHTEKKGKGKTNKKKTSEKSKCKKCHIM